MSSFSSWFIPPIGSSSSKQLRFERQRARQLDPLAQPVGERAGRLLAQILQFEKVDQLLAPLAMRDLLLLRQAPIDEGRQDARFHAHVAAEHDVVEHGHAAEQRDVLKGAGDPERGDLGRAEAGRVDALERDRAAVRADRSR